MQDTPPLRRQRVGFLVEQAHMFVLTNGVEDYDRQLEAHEAIAESLEEDWLLGKFFACRGDCRFMAAVPRLAADTLRRAIWLGPIV